MPPELSLPITVLSCEFQTGSRERQSQRRTSITGTARSQFLYFLVNHHLYSQYFNMFMYLLLQNLIIREILYSCRKQYFYGPYC